ncbi:MAG: methyltransferase domain-containing protein [Pseudomonadota bacterium]
MRHILSKIFPESRFWINQGTARSLKEYLQFRHRTSAARNKHLSNLDKVATEGGEEFKIKGYSYPAHRFVEFLVDRQYAEPGEVNWRERVVCPVTHLNNRMRVAVHVLDDLLTEEHWENSYITEKVTPLFKILSKNHSDLIGSEYLSPDCPPGAVNDAGIQHEDMCRLSFRDSTLGALLSFDCLEHIPDYQKAFEEAYRVLYRGGKFIWSAPFIATNYENLIRARIVDGEVQYLEEPQFHGDPISQDGILCYQEFGWQSLDQLRQIGFSDAYSLFVRSRHYGYLGPDQHYVIAIK